MIFPAVMEQLIAVVLERDAQNVTRELLRLGVLHFIGTQRLPAEIGEKIHEPAPEPAQERAHEARGRIESLLGIAGRPVGAAGAGGPGAALNIDGLSPVDLEEVDRLLDGIAAEIQEIRERQRSIQQEILRLEELRRQIETLSDLQTGVRSRPYTYLDVHTGSIPRSKLKTICSSLDELPSILLHLSDSGNRVNLFLITLRRDQAWVKAILADHGWVETEVSPELLGDRRQVLSSLDEKLAGLRREQEQAGGEVQRRIDRHHPQLAELWADLRLNELYYRIQSYFGKTQRTVVFSGWVPSAGRQELEEGIRRASGNRCYLEWHSSEEVPLEKRREIPVQFRNPRALVPFQMLVQNYSIPEYGTIEPTPFVAVAYLAMFGLMFADAGQGLVLALVGLLGGRLLPGLKQGTRNLLGLIAWCGLASIVTGVLFGSYFGFRLLPPLWFDYHGAAVGHAESGVVRDVFGILTVTIYFGIAVIGLGLLLNWINLIVRREWLRLVLDKGGVLGSWIFGGGVYAGFYFGANAYKALPPFGLLFLLIGLPSLLLMLKAPLAHLLRHGGKGLNLFSFIEFGMDWFVEMLEIFGGYLANALSFMRVAGLGIAHVTLMAAFFQIAGMEDGGAGVGSVLLLVLGNVLVILLEGLSAGIQSLRLNYYEFFSKYFRGAGQAYMPISLRSQEA